MENITDFRKLVPVANFGDSLILMVHENDVNNRNNPICVQVNLGFKKFDKIQGIGRYLKFNPYEPVDWKNPQVRYMYQDIIMREFDNDDITRMLSEFSQALEDK